MQECDIWPFFPSISADTLTPYPCVAPQTLRLSLTAPDSDFNVLVFANEFRSIHDVYAHVPRLSRSARIYASTITACLPTECRHLCGVCRTQRDEPRRLAASAKSYMSQSCAHATEPPTLHLARRYSATYIDIRPPTHSEKTFACV